MGLTESGRAFGMDRDVRAVAVSSAWGTGAGTVFGLLGWAFSRDVKTVFQGSSVGLYLGVAFGFYHITHRDDPQNPLRMRTQGEKGSSFEPLTPAHLQAAFQGSGGGRLSESQSLALEVPLFHVRF